jgi:hypothetical protein
VRISAVSWALSIVALAMLAGCSCAAPPGVPDASGRDAAASDAFSRDAPTSDVIEAPDALADTGSVDGGGAEAGGVDAEAIDSGAPSCEPGCGPSEICGASRDGNGIDDDCDDAVDEGCACTPGTARACFPGTPSRRGVGSCADGTMVCGADRVYGACTGGAFPIDEICNGADDDCDGTIDDGLTACATALLCPGSERAAPLSPHPLTGSLIDGGRATSWSWTVTCPSTVSTCPTPADPAARDTSIFLVSSGNYRVRLEVLLDDGTTNACEWIVYARGGGLRVEMDWDTQGAGRGDTDVDLHLHRRSIAPGETTGETDFFTADDCYYLTCKASTYGYDEGALAARWALPSTPDLSVCEGSPGGEGGIWVDYGACFNPRLDVDVISCDAAVTDPRSAGFCAPENVNIDDPPLGEPYRVWVNYYSQHSYVGDTHPSVNIYCWNELRGSFQGATLREGDGTTSARTHDSWWVADVVFEEDECGRPTCRIEPLGPVMRTATFGPPWSF